MTVATASTAAEPRPRWARLGLAAFLFFMAKGLLWLLLPALLWIGR